MTSPTQLKYLSAMGIPVWVSRELVFEETLSIETSSTQLTNSTPAHISNKNLEVPSNKVTHSAKSILDSLELSSSKKKNPEQHTGTNTSSDQSISQFVKNSVVASKLPNIRLPSNDSIAPSIIEAQNNENLLFQTPDHYVYSSGCKNPDWMVIGHSPELFNGIGQEPFAGEAGELLNNMLRATGVSRPHDQSYLLNVIDKHQDDSSITLNKQTETQLKLRQDLVAVINDVKPKIILIVGQKSAQNLLERNDPLIIMRSKIHEIANIDIPCVVTYYPSYLLQKLTDKRKAWNDLQLAMSLLNEQESKV